VKSAAASRQRRLQLQTRYGQAMMYSRGYASDESKTAFARARTLAAGVGDASERFDAYYGLFVNSISRGELSLARETAESFLREAEHEARMTDAAVARRNVGAARLHQGDFIDAEGNLATALRTYDPERDRDAKFRFGVDTGTGAMGYLALASWAMGDFERARALSKEALARADETSHAPTRAIVYHCIALYQMLRGDPEAVRRIGTIVVDLSREHGMALWLAFGEAQSSWARARLGDRETETTELRRALAAYFDTGNKLYALLFQGRLAELEAELNDAGNAGPTPSSTAFAATSCSSAITPIPRLLKRPSRPPSPSRQRRWRAVLKCKRPWRSPSSTNRPAAPPKPTPSLRRRTKALRRRPRCPRRGAAAPRGAH
jgi:tetratricopeptide (TPR) repeat protein